MTKKTKKTPVTSARGCSAIVVEIIKMLNMEDSPKSLDLSQRRVLRGNELSVERPADMP